MFFYQIDLFSFPFFFGVSICVLLFLVMDKTNASQYVVSFQGLLFFSACFFFLLFRADCQPMMSAGAGWVVGSTGLF
jgi:hypothetical protein